jgi:hypothetical protein
MSLKRNKIDSALTTKGFDKVNKKKDHYYYYLMVNGMDVGIFTKMSRGSKAREIGEPLIGIMAKQLRINRQQFYNLVDCTVEHDDYLDILRSNGINV